MSSATSVPSTTENPNRPAPVDRRKVLHLLGPLFKARWPHVAGTFVLLMVSSALVLVGPLLVRHAIDQNIAQSDWPGLKRTVLLYLGAMLAHLGVFYALRVWLEWVGQSMMAEIKMRLFTHLMALPMAFFDFNPPGKLLSRVENDTEALRRLFTSSSVMLLGDMVLFVGMFAVMIAVDWRLFLLVVAVLPVLVGTGLWVNRRVRPHFLASRTLLAEVCARLAESVQAVAELTAFNRGRWATHAFGRVNQRRRDREWRGEIQWMGWFNGVIMAETLSIALILGVGGMWALAGTVTIGTLVMFIGYVRRYFEPLLRLSDQMLIIQKAFVAGERLVDLLLEPADVEPALSSAAGDGAGPAPWPGVRHRITFEDVWFRYAPDGEWVLQGISLDIPAGQHWALVGATGSGKTTLASLLLRFYEPTKGRILIDGRDIRTLPRQTLRREIGLVLQELYLFPGSLKENLHLGRDVPAGAMERALRQTMATDLAETLNHAVIAEGGGNLSMGERQLLSFARALMESPSLVILDEATSAVDPETERRVQAGLQSMLADRTALIIAHRLSTVESADHILVLAEGRVEEAGTHAELLDRGGLYTSLHQLQFGGTDEAVGA